MCSYFSSFYSLYFKIGLSASGSTRQYAQMRFNPKTRPFVLVEYWALDVSLKQIEKGERGSIEGEGTRRGGDGERRQRGGDGGQKKKK